MSTDTDHLRELDKAAPTTEAGRVLLAFEQETCHPPCMDYLAEQIVLIESSARAALLDELDALRAVAEAARLRRNTTFANGDNIRWEGLWTAVPREDFEALRAALRRLDQQGGEK